MPTAEPKWYVLAVNPEPWRVGPLSVGRRKGGGTFPQIGRDQQLRAYQEAVQEELKLKYDITGTEPVDINKEWVLTIYFWHRLEEYESRSGRRARDQRADLTNLVKATEDAIQGFLIYNDVHVREQHTCIAERSGDIQGCVVIKLEEYLGFDPTPIPALVWKEINEITNDEQIVQVSNNAWLSREDF